MRLWRICAAGAKKQVEKCGIRPFFRRNFTENHRDVIGYLFSFERPKSNKNVERSETPFLRLRSKLRNAVERSETPISSNLLYY
jgi:hypothetical protein